MGEERLELPQDELSVGALLELLELRRPAFHGRLGTVRVAVNEEFAEASATLQGGEIVALIPPVSGG